MIKTIHDQWVSQHCPAELEEGASRSLRRHTLNSTRDQRFILTITFGSSRIPNRCSFSQVEAYSPMNTKVSKVGLGVTQAVLFVPFRIQFTLKWPRSVNSFFPQ